MKLIGANKLSAIMYILFFYDRKTREYAECVVTNISGVKYLADKVPVMTYEEFDELQKPTKARI